MLTPNVYVNCSDTQPCLLANYFTTRNFPHLRDLSVQLKGATSRNILELMGQAMQLPDLENFILRETSSHVGPLITPQEAREIERLVQQRFKRFRYHYTLDRHSMFFLHSLVRGFCVSSFFRVAKTDSLATPHGLKSLGTSKPSHPRTSFSSPCQKTAKEATLLRLLLLQETPKPPEA